MGSRNRYYKQVANKLNRAIERGDYGAVHDIMYVAQTSWSIEHPRLKRAMELAKAHLALMHRSNKFYWSVSTYGRRNYGV